MTVVMPGDAYETEMATRAAAATEGPFYLSLAGGEHSFTPPEAERTFEVGKAVTLREGSDVTIIAVGPTLPDAVKAAEMLAARNVSARVLNMHTVKPADREAILAAAKETRLIVTIEEHTVIGGLGGAVGEVLAEAGAGTPLRKLGLQDVFACMVGSYEDVRERFGISAEAVVDAVLSEN
jgi:transketolase